MQTTNKQAFGTIKWFGGLNRQTQKENNFGFIQDSSGKDVYLNRHDWKKSEPPREGQFVCYLIQTKAGKLSAHSALPLDDAEIELANLYDSICELYKNKCSSEQAAIFRRLCERFCSVLQTSPVEDIKKIANRRVVNLYKLVAGSSRAEDTFRLLIETTKMKITEDPWPHLNVSTVAYYEDAIAQELSELDGFTAQKKCELRSTLPPSLVVFLLLKGIYTTAKQLEQHDTERISDYLNSALFENTVDFPAYLKAAYDADCRLNRGSVSNPILAEILDLLRFKQSLYDKSSAYIDILRQTVSLKRNIEPFILGNLFSLLEAGNEHQTVIDVLMQRLWASLTSGEISFGNDASGLGSLFPACSEMMPLSCEAVYWKKADIYLCRGKVCSRPAVIPNTKKKYRDFNIYDWLAHYGISYAADRQPSSKDFPIKLAGYFNRVREIFPILHCDACRKLMLPDMRYSRTQYKDWKNGGVVKEMAAAYRSTVFHCNNDKCGEFANNYYINHCIGCYDIIDSRRLKTKCDEGKYICGGCGSCCRDHSVSQPAGFCPKCTSSLEVHEKDVQGRSSVYQVKYVECSSNQCDFTIEAGTLPTKFKSINPVLADPF